MLIASLALFACGRSSPGASADPSARPLASQPTVDEHEPEAARYLPARVGPYRGEKVESGEGWVRRAYVRGPVRVELTVAPPATPPMKFEQWVTMSAGYPAIALDVPKSDALGFLDCKGSGPAEQCNAHIHTRTGFHIEVTSASGVTREEVSALLASYSVRPLLAEPK